MTSFHISRANPVAFPKIDFKAFILPRYRGQTGAARTGLSAGAGNV